jgi:hypothetical protein
VNQLGGVLGDITLGGDPPIGTPFAPQFGGGLGLAENGLPRIVLGLSRPRLTSDVPIVSIAWSAMSATAHAQRQETFIALSIEPVTKIQLVTTPVTKVSIS